MEKTITADGVTVLKFDSAAEFANAAKPAAYDAAGWTGSTPAEAYDGCTIGDLACVVDAEKMLDKINAAVETTRSVWVPTVAGAYPIVPEYLIGMPLNMRRRTHVTNENAPLRIYLDLTASAGVDCADLAKRGIAFLALAMLLTKTRPVEMHAFTAIGTRGHGEKRNGIATIKLPTQPLDIAIAGGVFTKGIARTLGYQYIAKEFGGGWGGDWYKGIHPVNAEGDEHYTKEIRKALGVGPEDIIIGPVYYKDETIKSPVKFVQKMIDKHSQGGETCEG